MIEWLEDYLSRQQITIFMVTHDRYFLESICNEIIEIDDKRLYRYKGNYSFYLEKKTERTELEKTNVIKAKNLMRTELEWMRRMPKARGTKSKDRIERFYKLKEEASKNLSEQELVLEIKTRRTGGKILEIENLNKSFGKIKIIHDFSYKFQKNEHIGIVGKNGIGKSTLLNLITKKISPDSGTIETGTTIEFGYYTQS